MEMMFICKYNLCQKSWNTCIISAAHLVVSPSPRQNNVVIYSVERCRKAAILADPSLTNKHLILHCFGGEGTSIVRHG